MGASATISPFPLARRDAPASTGADVIGAVRAGDVTSLSDVRRQRAFEAAPGLAAAGLPAVVAEDADPKHSWAAFLPVFAWMHEGGRAVGERAQAAGYRLEDLFCIVLTGGAAPSLLFKDPVTGASTTVDAVGVH